MWYAGKFDDATWPFLATLGLTNSQLKERGIGMVAVEQHVKYKSELHAGDTISIRTRVLEVKDKTLRFTHEMLNEETGEIAAETTITGICIDARTRRARSLPSDIRECVLKLIDRSGDLDYETSNASSLDLRDSTVAAGSNSKVAHLESYCRG
jgi:acyl-CoA thioester hydrolase